MPETTYGPDSAGSQAERTALAWSRTIISMAAVVAFVAIHGGIEGAPLPAVVALTAVAGALLLAASATTRRIWSRAVEAMSGRRGAPNPVATATVAAASALVAALALLSIAATRQG